MIRLSLDTGVRSVYISPQRSDQLRILGGPMNFNKGVSWFAGVMFALAVPSMALAQPGAFGGGFGPPLSVVNPPKVFTTSDGHYTYLLERAKGGTKQTLGSLPRWDG